MFKVLLKRLLVVLLFVSATGLFAQSKIVTLFDDGKVQNESVLMRQNDNTTTIQFRINEFELVEVRTDYGQAHIAMSGKAPLIMEAGNPEMFFLTSTFIIPDQGGSELEVSYGEFTDYVNIEIAPSKGNLTRDIDPQTVPYVKGEVYSQDKFYPEALAGLREPFIMRDVRGQSLDVFPLQYNPVTKVLRVYSEITVTIHYTESEGINEFTNQKRHASIEPQFNEMYKSLFLNHSAVMQSRAYPTGEEGELLIICHPAFMPDMQPYVDWKRTIGRKTTMVSTAVAGTTVSALKSYISGYYNNPANNLAYVLFVGDVQHIPISNTGDVDYAKITGSDNFLEILMGRMSCETNAHVQTQVQRSIEYERDETTSATWLSAGLGIGANEGAGSGHDGGEADYVHINNIRTRLMTYGYDPVWQEYSGVGGGTSAAQISSRFNSGVGVTNYCNHGSETSWGVASYSNSHVNQLQNAGKLPYIFSVACLNGKLDYSGGPCFAEAWLRATQSGQPTGAVATFMAYISISWQPPMTAQDEFVNICIDLPSPYPGQQPGIKRTVAGAMLNASQKMIMVHSGSTADYNSWMVFGDPTLMIRTKTPQAMTVSHPPVIFFGMNEFAVNCDAEGALVTMSALVGGEVVILGTAVVSGGVANLNLTEPISAPVPLTIAIVARDKVTYLGEVLATPASGPYIIPAGYSVIGEDKLTYISTNKEIEVTLNNVGIEATNNLTVTMTCDDPQLTIVNGTATCSGIAADGSATVHFTVTIANDIPDNKTFLTDVAITEGGKGSWSGNLSLKAYAPVFTLEKILVNGVENGNLAAGSVATVTTVVKNTGGAGAYKVKGDLDIHSPYVTFACEDQTDPGQNLPTGETINIPFVVVTAAGMPYGHQANIDLLLAAQYGRSATAPFTVSNVGANSYCSSGNQNCGESDKFTSVVLYKTSAPGTLLINNTSGACSSGGYQDYTSTIVALEPGEQYTIKVKVGYSNQSAGGWFDLNGNNVFDSNEKLITFSSMTSGTEYTQNFTIPTDFTPGTSRFRLVCKYNGTPVACGNESYGQTHDYTITLPELYPRVDNVVAVLNEANITVTWNAPTGGTPNGYNIYRNGDKLNTSLLTTTTFTEENITNGVYAYNVTAVYGTKESFAQISNVICNFTSFDIVLLADPPEGGEVEGGGTYPAGEEVTVCATPNPCYVFVNWTEDDVVVSGEPCYKFVVEGNRTLTAHFTLGSYEIVLLANPGNGGVVSGGGVYTCGDEITIQAVANPEYVFINWTMEDDEILTDASNYTFAVMGNLTLTANFDGDVAIDVIETAGITIYPNPTDGKLQITNYELGITNVEIYDVMGCMVKTRFIASPQDGTTTIDISNLSTGVYFIRIQTEEGIVTRKVVKR